MKIGRSWSGVTKAKREILFNQKMQIRVTFSKYTGVTKERKSQNNF